MKKAGILLCGALAGVMFVGLGGCGQTPTACNILIEDAKTSFAIGEAFAFSDEMQVKLVLSNDSTREMETPADFDFTHDAEGKKYVGQNYVIDYSEFNNASAGEYAILLTYLDGDKNANNDVVCYYMVSVLHTANAFTTMPAVDEEWTWGETPTFTAPVAQHNNENLKYSYKQTNVAGAQFVEMNNENIEDQLKALDAGTYDLKVAYTQTSVYAGIEEVLHFTINRASLPSGAEDIPTIPSEVFTGDVVSPQIEDTQYYTVEHSNDWVQVGTHNVVLRLKDANYKWADTDDITKTVQFEITAATNVWTNANFGLPTLEGETKGWAYGTFEPMMITLPQAQFGAVALEVKAQDADDEEYQATNIAMLTMLTAGEYTLKAYIPESNNYSSLEAITINFVVQAAE